MKKKFIPMAIVLLFILSMAVAACSNETSKVTQEQTSSLPTSTSTAATYTDPFNYCGAVGTIDTPDTRYTGEQVPDAVINGFKKAASLEDSTEPTEMFKKTTIWRCMDSKVYACNYGANLPCSSKADTEKTPSQAMNDYCSANPDSDSIPMSVTGHATIYSWKCVKDTAQLINQTAQVDAAGYLADIWYPIEANVPASNTPTTGPTDTQVATTTSTTAVAQDIQPLAADVCTKEAQAMAKALGVTDVTQSTEVLNDVVNNKSGTGCQATIKGTGTQFKSPDDVAKTLGNLLLADGWTEDIKLEAGGATGIGAGYRKGDQISLVSANWEADASANCSNDQPISACNVKPAQQNYTITLIFGEEK